MKRDYGAEFLAFVMFAVVAWLVGYTLGERGDPRDYYQPRVVEMLLR